MQPTYIAIDSSRSLAPPPRPGGANPLDLNRSVGAARPDIMPSMADFLVKVAAMVFCVNLACAHLAIGLQETWPLPMSRLRDGELAWLGYLAFTSLAALGALYLGGLVRHRQGDDAAVAAFSLVLLAVVAMTPSDNGLHLNFALLLLAYVYVFYGLLLHRSGHPLLTAHLAAPIILAVATRVQTYGVFQKCLILYFVLAAVIHHHAVSRAERRALDAAAQLHGRRRRVFRVEVDQGDSRVQRRDVQQ